MRLGAFHIYIYLAGMFSMIVFPMIGEGSTWKFLLGFIGLMIISFYGAHGIEYILREEQ